MAKTLKLTVTIESPDGNPGRPTRFIAVFDKMKKMIGDGATAGEFDQDYEYTQGGEPTRDICTVRYAVTSE